MKSVTSRPPDDEMETPRIGSLIGSVVFYSIPPALLALAVWNLVWFRDLPWITARASVVWIVFTVWYVWTSISMDGGFQRWAIARLGQFGMRHFVWIDRITGEPPRISTGFRWGRRRFLYDSFPAIDLLKVSWNHGQASALSQQELADWSAMLWFQPTEPRSKWWSDTFRGQCGFGFCGEKARIAAFGESLVDFLRRAGVEFETLPEGYGYRVVSSLAHERNAADAVS